MSLPAKTSLLACPCCGYATLTRLANFDPCDVCLWDDPGQDTPDADMIIGTRDQISLTHARYNFILFGIADPRDADLLEDQAPRENFARLRAFELRDGNDIVEVGVGVVGSLSKLIARRGREHIDCCAWRRA